MLRFSLAISNSGVLHMLLADGDGPGLYKLSALTGLLTGMGHRLKMAVFLGGGAPCRLVYVNCWFPVIPPQAACGVYTPVFLSLVSWLLQWAYPSAPIIVTYS